MCICTMVYLIVFHFSELFTYLNKMFVAFDQWGSDNRGFTVLELLHLLLQLCFMLKTGTYKGGRSLMYNEKDYLLLGRIDREQIRSRINNNDCRTFRPRRPLSTAYRTKETAV